MSGDPQIVNEQASYQLAQAQPDAVVRNLVLLGLAKARMRFIRGAGQSEGEWRRGAPSVTFDMLFYAQLLVAMFERTELIRALLDGQTLEEAAGWNVE
jgi:hypothetical protein